VCFSLWCEKMESSRKWSKMLFKYLTI